MHGAPIRDDIDRTHPGTGRTSAVCSEIYLTHVILIVCNQVHFLRWAFTPVQVLRVFAYHHLLMKLITCAVKW